MTEATCVSSINPRDGRTRDRLHRPAPALPGDESGAPGRRRRGRSARPRSTRSAPTPAARPLRLLGLREGQRQPRRLPGRRLAQHRRPRRQDAKGYFWLTGRAKDLIIRGGHNIDPAIIEEGLMRHPAVDIAAAVGKPDGHAGELPMAYVTLRKGARCDPAELLAHARSTITERAAVPVEVVVLDADAADRGQQDLQARAAPAGDRAGAGRGWCAPPAARSRCRSRSSCIRSTGWKPASPPHGPAARTLKRACGRRRPGWPPCRRTGRLPGAPDEEHLSPLVAARNPHGAGDRQVRRQTRIGDRAGRIEARAAAAVAAPARALRASDAAARGLMRA